MRSQFHFTALLVWILFYSTQGVQAQQLTDAASETAQALLKKGVDTVLIYKPYTSHIMLWTSDSSFIEQVRYVITKESGQLVFDRVTTEFHFTRGDLVTHQLFVRPDTLNIFDFLRDHFRSVFSDTVLHAMVKYQVDGKDTLMRHTGSHASYVGLVALTKTGTYSNGFIDYDLYDGTIHNEDGSVRDKIEVINYDYNISTPIYKIISLLQQVERVIENGMRSMPSFGL